jgi:hypothetical protein
MLTKLLGRDNTWSRSLSLLWPLLIIWLGIFGLALSPKAQNQPIQERTTMANASDNHKPLLDLQVPAVTETAGFALG